MYINQMKINKLNKELLVLKEDYAKMIVKSIQKQIRTKSGDVYTIRWELLQAYKRAVFKAILVLENQGKKKTNQLISYNDKLNLQKVAKQKLLVENKKEKETLVKEKQEQEKLVNSIKKDKNRIVSDIRKNRESKTIKQIDRLIREANEEKRH
jgi:hypothetical protein